MQFIIKICTKFLDFFMNLFIQQSKQVKKNKKTLRKFNITLLK